MGAFSGEFSAPRAISIFIYPEPVVSEQGFTAGIRFSVDVKLVKLAPNSASTIPLSGCVSASLVVSPSTWTHLDGPHVQETEHNQAKHTP